MENPVPENKILFVVSIGIDSTPIIDKDYTLVTNTSTKICIYKLEPKQNVLLQPRSQLLHKVRSIQRIGTDV